MTEGDGVIRLAAFNVSSALLRQIEAWCAAFRHLTASIEAVTAVEADRYDLCLVEVDPAVAHDDIHDGASVNTLEALALAAGRTPLLAVAPGDDEGVAEQVAMAGFSAFLVMTELDAVRFERILTFALQQRRTMDAMRAREMALVEVAERERQAVANALHDGPLQDLIGARFLVGALAPAESTSGIQESLQVVIQGVRALCSELKPPALAPFGLEKAIRAHSQALSARHPEIEMSVELANDGQQLPEWARYALFRFYQAAVDNVAKHAQATHLRVQLRMDDDSVRLSVADDGQGFALPQQWLDFARSGRYGYLLMQERADALRGRMMVQSTLGSGTRVSVHAPLDQPLLPLSVPMGSLMSSLSSSTLPTSLVVSPPLSSPANPITPSVPDRNG